MAEGVRRSAGVETEMGRSVGRSKSVQAWPMALRASAADGRISSWRKSVHVVKGDEDRETLRGKLRSSCVVSSGVQFGLL